MTSLATRWMGILAQRLWFSAQALPTIPMNSGTLRRRLGMICSAMNWLVKLDIRIRRGEGAFIAPLVGSAMSPALISLHARHQDAFLSYLEFRATQESFAAGLAASRATDADREILTRVMEQLENAQTSNDVAASKKADIKFHSAIIDASHNSLLVHTMASIYALTEQNLFYNRSFLRSIDGTGKQLQAQHREVFEAIHAGESERASAAAKDHSSLSKSLTMKSNHARNETRFQVDASHCCKFFCCG